MLQAPIGRHLIHLDGAIDTVDECPTGEETNGTWTEVSKKAHPEDTE